jgi:precorrin-6x reductase
MDNTLYLVSAGPGHQEYIAPAAHEAISSSTVIVAYDYYLNWMRDWLPGKEVITLPLTQERQRVHAALQAARQGKTTSLISSGDIGIYGLAPLLFEEMAEREPFCLKVIPGISASNASASLLGAPLAHDFITLSLSDLLCPWAWIEMRARAAASADLCLALYNVQSKKRQDGIYKIIDILLEQKLGTTLCGVVHNAYRDDQSTKIVTLAELKNITFDMFTCIIVGNRYTARKGEFMFTPRGYNSFAESSAITGSKAPNDLPDLPDNAVWVFSGTSDGNALAKNIAESGLPVIISSSTEYGATLAKQTCPKASIIFGSLGMQKRAQLLKHKRAKIIVDATHPFSQQISEQLRSISKQCELEYIQFKRQPAEEVKANNVHYCDTIESAALLGAKLGKRIFLATGTRHIAEYLKTDDNRERRWFARVAPDQSYIENAVAAGIRRQDVIAMQGPFTQEFNAALWRNWKIDLVITKDSGDAGGLPEKIAAAVELQIPIVVLRSPVQANGTANSFQHIVEMIKNGAAR